jgi:rare lipoprotein A
MRILRFLPLAVGLAVATVVVPVTPASADTLFRFRGDSEYRDSISVNHWARKSKLGALPREDSEDRPLQRNRASSRRASRSEERVRRAERRDRSRSSRRMTRDDDDAVEQSYESRRPHRRGARKRVASLGSGVGGGWSSGGGSGMASFYWQPQRVASGGWFNPNAMTAAHKTLPFGTRVRVTHLGNGRSVIVRINDRGPYIRGRVIDLSRAAAGVIGMIGQGVARIRMEVLGR